jgi:hypothetical protein
MSGQLWVLNLSQDLHPLEMATDDFTEAVYQRLLRNITSPGWQTNRGVVSSPPPLSPTRGHFN